MIQLQDEVVAIILVTHHARDFMAVTLRIERHHGVKARIDHAFILIQRDGARLGYLSAGGHEQQEI